jgi:hypothetical protein
MYLDGGKDNVTVGLHEEFAMDANELVSVYTLSDPGTAEIIKNALIGEGIRCELGGEGQAGFTGLFEISVLVRATDAERARAIIESHGRGTHTDGS